MNYQEKVSNEQATNALKCVFDCPGCLTNEPREIDTICGRRNHRLFASDLLEARRERDMAVAKIRDAINTLVFVRDLLRKVRGILPYVFKSAVNKIDQALESTREYAEESGKEDVE